MVAFAAVVAVAFVHGGWESGGKGRVWECAGIVNGDVEGRENTLIDHGG